MTTACRREFAYAFSSDTEEFVPSVIVAYDPECGLWTTHYRSPPEDDTLRATYNLSVTCPATGTRQDKTLRQRPLDMDDD